MYGSEVTFVGGWSDRAILDLNLVVAYFAFVNRLAHGLGVQLEQGRDERR